MKNTLFALALAATAWFGPEASAGTPWIIKKASWSASDEKNYSNFVESIYASKCNSVDKCMKGSGNWYRDRDPDITWYADCGRFPYLLRAYFAFHNNLPFQGAVDAARRDPEDPNPVLKYSAHGVFITARRAAQTGIDGYKFILRAVDAAYTVVYRVDTRIDVPTGQFSDFYNVAINRKNIRPGTVVYDPNGHVAMVAKVWEDGKITLLDSHPDNSVSRVPYTSAFQAVSPRQGGGLKNWRPIKIVGAATGPNGELNGGQTVTLANADSPGFSLEQYVGDQTNPKGSFGAARWSTSDGVLGASQFMDVVRARLSVGSVNYEPVKEVRDGVNALCVMLQDRADSVKAAVQKNIDQKSMPDGRLPGNIYGTDGEWESFSTPSRDARLKTAAAEFRSLMAKIIKLAKQDSSKIVYSGENLFADTLQAYDQAASACSLVYTKSNGETQSVSYTDAISRLYKMSFDPYHCIELRWGATSAAELSACATASGDKLEWYKAEQRLRNSLDRKYDRQMGWSLDELKERADMGATPSASVGSDTQVPLDVRALLVAAASGPSPAPGPAPTPTPTPTPTNGPNLPPTADFCSGLYDGNMTNFGENAQLRVSATDMSLNVNDTSYHGQGKCRMISATQAKFRFVLDDDANYVFAGVITADAAGSISLYADEIKKGKVIDHLKMIRLPLQ